MSKLITTLLIALATQSVMAAHLFTCVGDNLKIDVSISVGQLLAGSKDPKIQFKSDITNGVFKGLTKKDKNTYLAKGSVNGYKAKVIIPNEHHKDMTSCKSGSTAIANLISLDGSQDIKREVICDFSGTARNFCGLMFE